MTALLSLTNSSSNQSDITQLPFRPQSKWPHFPRERSSMSTTSFKNPSCEGRNGGDKGRRMLLKTCPLFSILTAWKSGPRSAWRAAQGTVTGQGSGLTCVPRGDILLSNLKDSGRRTMWGSCYYQLCQG